MVLPTEDMFYYHGHSETDNLGVWFQVHRAIVGNLQFRSIIGHVASLVVRLNKKQTLDVVHVYAPTPTLDDEDVDVFKKTLN